MENHKYIETPCYIGDKVYHIGKRDKIIHVSMVKQILITRDRIYIRLKCGKKGVVGKDIFLTEEEAAEQQKNVLMKQGG